MANEPLQQSESYRSHLLSRLGFAGKSKVVGMEAEEFITQMKRVTAVVRRSLQAGHVVPEPRAFGSAVEVVVGHGLWRDIGIVGCAIANHKIGMVYVLI
jgi:hypothetical protein